MITGTSANNKTMNPKRFCMKNVPFRRHEAYIVPSIHLAGCQSSLTFCQESKVGCRSHENLRRTAGFADICGLETEVLGKLENSTRAGQCRMVKMEP